MPTFTGKTFANFYKNILGINQSSNTGVDATTRVVHDGDGNSSSLSLSDDVLSVQPVNDDTTRTMLVKNKGGSNILAVDTTNSQVLAGAGQVNATTLYKEMGLYDFSPTAGVHNPLVANNMMFSDSGVDIIEDTSMFGNGADPATTLDLSADGTPSTAIACYWVLDENITLDKVTWIATADGSATLNFHIFSYQVHQTLGDLSNGTVQASGTVAATSTTVKTNVLTLDAADINKGRVVIGFIENATDTSDVSVSFSIKYHVR